MPTWSWWVSSRKHHAASAATTPTTAASTSRTTNRRLAIVCVASGSGALTGRDATLAPRALLRLNRVISPARGGRRAPWHEVGARARADVPRVVVETRRREDPRALALTELRDSGPSALAG